MKKKFIFLYRFIPLSLSILFILNASFVSNADELEDKLEQQQQVQEELDNLSGNMSDAQNEIENITNELEKLEQIQALKEAEKQQHITELEDLQKAILSIDQEVAELQEEFDQKESLFIEGINS